MDETGGDRHGSLVRARPPREVIVKRSIGQWDSGTGHEKHLEIEDVLKKKIVKFLKIQVSICIKFLMGVKKLVAKNAMSFDNKKAGLRIAYSIKNIKFWLCQKVKNIKFQLNNMLGCRYS